MAFNAGQVVESGRTAELLREPRHVYTRALLEASPRLGDSRDRLPSIARVAPWLRDTRELPESEWPATRLEQVAPGHWVRTDAEVAA